MFLSGDHGFRVWTLHSFNRFVITPFLFAAVIHSARPDEPWGVLLCRLSLPHCGDWHPEGPTRGWQQRDRYLVWSLVCMYIGVLLYPIIYSLFFPHIRLGLLSHSSRGTSPVCAVVEVSWRLEEACCCLTRCLQQEKPGSGGKSAPVVWGGPVWAGQAAVWFPYQALPRHASAGTAADLHLLAHAAPWAYIYPNAHLPGQPSQLCYYSALRLAWTGWY